MNECMFLQMGGYSDMGYGMGYSMGGGWMIIGWLFMILFWVAIVLFIIWLYKQIRGPAPQLPGVETAQEVLKKRYANGQITKDQFKEMKEELEG